MATKTAFSGPEWQLLKDAPHWMQIALRATKRSSTLATARRDPKVVSTVLAEYKADNQLIREVVAARDEASQAKESASLEEATQTFKRIADLLDRKVDRQEADEFREFLLTIGERMAEATGEGLLGMGKKVSDKEAEALKSIAVALRATEEDKKQREEEARQATVAAPKKEAEAARQREEEARRQREAETAKKQREAEARQATLAAQKKEAEAARQREEEARKERDAEMARKQREAEARQATLAAQKKEAEAARQREEEARQAAVAAQKKEAAAAKQREVETGRQREAEAVKQAVQVQIYEVKPGDSLSKIAKHFYGDASRWPEIFEANRDQIKDPNLIYPGQKFRIPQ